MMRRTISGRCAICAIILVFCVAAPVAAGSLEDAAAAYANGDYATLLRLLRPLADRGNALAQNILGTMYRDGEGVPQNYAAALNWFQKAADQRNAEAQNNLGAMYANGCGVPQDYAAAVSWYRKAADQGNADAQNNLGVMYFLGEDAQQDYVGACMWLSLAAAAGNDKSPIALNVVATYMTHAQISEAQKLAREWKPKSQ